MSLHYIATSTQKKKNSELGAPIQEQGKINFKPLERPNERENQSSNLGAARGECARNSKQNPFLSRKKIREQDLRVVMRAFNTESTFVAGVFSCSVMAGSLSPTYVKYEKPEKPRFNLMNK